MFMKLVLVDDDVLVCSALARPLVRLGHASRTATTVESALALVEAEDPTAVVTDLDLGPGGNGVELISALRRRGDRRRAILMTGSDLGYARERLDAAGLEDITILAKPFELAQLLEALGEPSTRPISGLPRAEVPMSSFVGNVVRAFGGGRAV
ncbi:MAG TPA: response regulator [Polyangia bacterium]|nr:response regulator [Polyangia bacterium]